MGGGTQRPTTTHPLPHPTPRHPCAPLLVIPAQPGTHTPVPSFLRPLPVIPAQAGTPTPHPPLSPHAHPHPTTPFPNSSLPPFRGEARWGVGGTDRPPTIAPASIPLHSPPTTHPAIPAPLRSVIPAQAGTPRPPAPQLAPTSRRHTQLLPHPPPTRHPPSPIHPSKNTHTPHTPPPPPIHPSPLLGGRLGGGWEATTHHHPPSPTPRAPPPPVPSFLRRQEPPRPPPRHSCAPRSVIPAQAGTRTPPIPSSLRPPLPVIPAQAGTRTPHPPLSPHAHPHPTTPFPNSSLPPFRGEARWGVGGNDPPPPTLSHTPRTPPPRSVIPAQAGTRATPSPSPSRHSCAPPFRHSCAGRNPHTPRSVIPAPPSPSFLRRQEPPRPPHPHPTTPLPQFIPPPF